MLGIAEKTSRNYAGRSSKAVPIIAPELPAPNPKDPIDRWVPVETTIPEAPRRRA